MLHWLAQASSFAPIAALYAIGKCTVVAVVHQGIALDGTFMSIKKPAEYGDTYFCYKHFNAIIVLGCVDARGIFTYVNAGRQGSVGDSYTFRHSALY